MVGDRGRRAPRDCILQLDWHRVCYCMRLVDMSDEYETKDVVVAGLRLDLKNPRFAAYDSSQTEDDLIKFLYEEADLAELLLSFLSSGYLPFEPIVVREADSIVLEGNRRVAALKLIADPAKRNKLGVTLPSVAAPKTMPVTIKAVLVKDRNEARSFIGFKHINGPKPWDALAKAKYASEWHNEGDSLEIIAKSVGDTFKTVHRLVHGYKILHQAIDAGFELERMSRRRLAFSHLYTAITRKPVRDWLGLEESEEAGLVPDAKLDRLRILMSWLYGQGKEEPAVVRSQNPDLNRLSDVIAHEGARDVLIATRDLQVAWEETATQSERLERSLIQAVKHTESAAALQGSFESSQDSIFQTCHRLVRSAQALYVNFRAVKEKADTGLVDLDGGE